MVRLKLTMKVLPLFISLSFALFIFGAGLARAQMELPEDPAQGKRLFDEKGCLKCHQILGKGGSVGPSLKGDQLNRSLLDMAAVLWNHAPKMLQEMRQTGTKPPAFNADEMGNLLVFLYSAGFADRKGDPGAGNKVFTDKSCSFCHSVGGQGGSYGPQLDKFKKYGSPIAMGNSLWNHGPWMSVMMARLGLSVPKFQGDELLDIMAYIEASSKEPKPAAVTPALPENPREGEKLFLSKGCGQCHSVRGIGGHIGPALDEAKLRGSLMSVAGSLWNHGPDMWKKMDEMGIEVPKFTGREMANLISYLYFIQFYDRPGDAAKGQELLTKKGCSNCHSVRGSGGTTAPDLAKSPAIATSIGKVAAMWNHASIMAKRAETIGVPWPTFSREELVDLLEYLKTSAR